MKYLSPEQILAIHALVLEGVGGSDGVREPGMLASLAVRPQAVFGNREMYPTMFLKAAALCEAIVNYHVFVDGNKRTAFVSMSRFLSMNGWEVEAENQEVVETMLAVAQKSMNLEELADWLEQHAKEIGN